jgi:hypothetical protein
MPNVCAEEAPAKIDALRRTAQFLLVIKLVVGRRRVFSDKVHDDVFVLFTVKICSYLSREVKISGILKFSANLQANVKKYMPTFYVAPF